MASDLCSSSSYRIIQVPEEHPVGTTLMLAVVLTLAPFSTMAQQQPVPVIVFGHSDSPVEDQVKARIGGTLRYTLGKGTYTTAEERLAAAMLTLDIACIKTKAGTTFVGYACVSSVSYYPFGFGGLSSDLNRNANQLITCPTDGVGCAEGIFDSFVAGTQADKLAEALKDLNAGVLTWPPLLKTLTAPKTNCK